MNRAPLLLAVACSGAGALIFETLWLRSAAWLVGSSAVAAATVLAAMMAGLALGGWLAARTAHTAANPARRYAGVELLAAAGGLLLVLGMPALATGLAPALGDLAGHRGWLQAARLTLALVLLAVPAAAMGYSLPLLTRAWAEQADLGRVLGRLYAVNTAGAVAGTVATEWLLVPWLGVAASAGVAAALLGLAACLALTVQLPGSAEPAPTTESLPRRWLLVAAAGGALALAAEVLWLRTLVLQVAGTAPAFAAMLAWLLAGLALGGVLGMRLARRARAALPWLALAAGASLVLGLWLATGTRALPADGWRLWVLGAMGLLPGFVCSGALFTVLAQLLGEAGRGHANASGRLTTANLLGGALGAWCAGLWLLPALGLAQAWVCIVLGYTALAAALWHRRANGVGIAALVAAALAVGPAIDRQLADARAPWQAVDDSTLVALHHGRVDTGQLLRQDFLGQPLAWRLVTNRYSMSSTADDSRRYMSAFAWWPLALAEAPRDALLISHGLGTTAAALLSDPGLAHLDVVDISRGTLRLSQLARQHEPLGDPLLDPRTTVHVEDGRFWLASQARQYDLITGEPPPPRLAGVVNLYTAEHFALMRRRLRPGGVASYWLPVDQLSTASAQAITAAFCGAFEHCLLAAGSHYNWVLVGLTAPPTGLRTALWETPAAYALRTSGFDTPALLGATLIADDDALRAWAKVPPLHDDRPGRLDTRPPETAVLVDHARWSQQASTVARQAPWLAGLPVQQAADFVPLLNGQLRGLQPELADLALQRGVVSPLLAALNSGWTQQRIVAGTAADNADAAYHQGVGLLARREPDRALDALLVALKDDAPHARTAAVLAACWAGEAERARGIAGGLVPGMRCWADPDTVP